MFGANEAAWRCWRLCSRTGRDPWSGRLRAEAVTAVLLSLDGHVDDLDKVMTIEDIAEELRPGKDGEETENDHE